MASSPPAARQAALRPTTAETYHNFITAYILPHIGQVRLQQVTPELLRGDAGSGVEL